MDKCPILLLYKNTQTLSTSDKFIYGWKVAPYNVDKSIDLPQIWVVRDLVLQINQTKQHYMNIKNFMKLVKINDYC